MLGYLRTYSFGTALPFTNRIIMRKTAEVATAEICTCTQQNNGRLHGAWHLPVLLICIKQDDAYIFIEHTLFHLQQYRPWCHNQRFCILAFTGLPTAFWLTWLAVIFRKSDDDFQKRFLTTRFSEFSSHILVQSSSGGEVGAKGVGVFGSSCL